MSEIKPIRFGKSKLKLCLLSCVTGDRFSWQTDVTNPFKEAYSRLWGYDYIFIEYNGSPLGRHPYWDRIWYIERNLPKYDGIWWLDADAAPVNFVKSVEDFIDLEHDFYISPETVSGEVYFNVGSFIVMNSEWGRGLLKKWGSEEVWNEFRRDGNPEQNALTTLYRRNWSGAKERIKVLGRNDINSAGVGCGHVWRSGDLVKHLPCGKRREDFRKEFWRGLDAGYFGAFGIRM